MSAQAIQWIIGGPLLLGLLLLSWYAMEESQRRLNDPADDRTIFISELASKSSLHPSGTYQVTIYRQSGGVHSNWVVSGTAHDAVAQAVATLRRARIEAVHIAANDVQHLKVGRLYHNHRGRNEGRKVGGAEVVVVERGLALSEIVSNFKVQFTVACDCGQVITIEIDRIRQARKCEGCGKTIAFSEEQASQINNDLADARQEALERLQKGQTSIRLERNRTIED